MWRNGLLNALETAGTYSVVSSCQIDVSVPWGTSGQKITVFCRDDLISPSDKKVPNASFDSYEPPENVFRTPEGLNIKVLNIGLNIVNNLQKHTVRLLLRLGL